MSFQFIGDRAVINSLFKAAGYTYGPLLGLFAFGLTTNLRVREYLEIGSFRFPILMVVCFISPIISFFVDIYSSELLGGFEFGFLILAFNGFLTYVGLLLLSDFSSASVENSKN